MSVSFSLLTVTQAFLPAGKASRMAALHYREVIAALRDTHKELADLHKQRAQVKKSAPAIDQQIEGLVRGYRRQLLAYRAAARLALAGEVEVLPPGKRLKEPGRVRYHRASVKDTAQGVCCPCNRARPRPWSSRRSLACWLC